jgi:hypothetical protein
VKAPPDATQPITADRLRKIMVDLGFLVPPSGELGEMAAAFAVMQLFNRDPRVELASEPGVSVKSVVTSRDRVARLTGKETITKVPIHLRPAFARGDMKHWRQKNWRDFAPDIAARFRQAMKKMDPNLPLGDRDGPVASFVAAVIPLIFPDQRPSASAVGQFLARKTRARR